MSQSQDNSYLRNLRSRLQFVPGLPILIVIGARRVGKTTLLREWYSELERPKAWLDGDNPAHFQLWQRLASGQTANEWLTNLTGEATGERYLFIDEAQMLPDSSTLIKHLSDSIPEARVVMSGSSALKLKDLSAESMAGRKQMLELYPLNLIERLSLTKPAQLEFNAPSVLREMLIWGGFPGVLKLPEGWQRQTYLADVIDSVLYRDLLGLVRSKDTNVFRMLLVLLARNVGTRLSTRTLAQNLEISRVTVNRYLDLLVEASVIRLLPGITASGVVPKVQPKVFFVDNGILSLLLADDRVLEVRKPEDQGLLLENFFVSEMVKYLAYKGDSLTQLGYLWHDKGEIDLVEYRNGIQRAWEVKLGRKQGGGVKTRNALAGASFTLVNLENIVAVLQDLKPRDKTEPKS
jgi:uncharacterized protein